MSNEIPDAKGHGWRLRAHSDKHHAVLEFKVALGCDAYLTLDLSNPAIVTVPIPLDLARRIAQVPEVKIVHAEGIVDLMPHWVTLMELMLAAGLTSKLKASNIASLYPEKTTPKPMRGAAVALWRRKLLGRVAVDSASHYWLTEKGLAVLGRV